MTSAPFALGLQICGLPSLEQLFESPHERAATPFDRSAKGRFELAVKISQSTRALRDACMRWGSMGLAGRLEDRADDGWDDPSRSSIEHGADNVLEIQCHPHIQKTNAQRSRNDEELDFEFVAQGLPVSRLLISPY